MLSRHAHTAFVQLLERGSDSKVLVSIVDVPVVLLKLVITHVSSYTENSLI